MDPMTPLTPDIQKPVKRDLADLFKRIRSQTESLCQPLLIEDHVLQTQEDVSPPKWHLAHSTWFFENFVLKEFKPDYIAHNEIYAYLFNSYYHQAGKRWQRNQRGYLSRPSVEEVYEYRNVLDQGILKLIDEFEDIHKDLSSIIELGLNHEQQHQELLLYDIKHILSLNPVFPVYNICEGSKETTVKLPDDYYDFVKFDEGVFEVGHSGNSFAYDNEMPSQKVYLHDFEIRKGLVTNEEFIEFVEDGGYHNSLYWLDDGWSWLKVNGISSPLYWELQDGQWMEKTLNGLQRLNLNAPLTHISFYEAEAYATYRNKRLPTEFEWEIAARIIDPDPKEANFLESLNFHPKPCRKNHDKLYQLLGDVWEWTNSAYLPYHGYKKAEGAIGEYNGKFMVNQMVLRGGSCATPVDHIRLSYRNFFHPGKRWAFTGLRLAK